MKTFKKMILLFAVSVFLTSCVMHVHTPRRDNGKHKGWYKNKNNPHHPASKKPAKTSKVIIITKN
jgi:hypothetical protein